MDRQQKKEQVFDTLIKNAMVYDGTLSPPVGADIGIKKDIIVEVGAPGGTADRVIDAKGMMVTPGFIDVHTHCDLTFIHAGIKRHLARFMPSWKGNHNFLYQGVTTVVTGNCGDGYPDTDRWLSMVDRLPMGTNVGHLIPHGRLRENLLAENDPNVTELTLNQQERLEAMVAEEMYKGALGMSAGLAYAPGLHARTKELISLCKVVDRENGVFATHMRDETGQLQRDGKFAILDAIDETLEIAWESGVSTQISHLKIKPPFNNIQAEQILEPILLARQGQMDIHGDQYPYAASSTHLTILLPHDLKLGPAIKKEYRNTSGRADIERYIKKTFSWLGPDKMLITMNPGDQSIAGRTLAEIAEGKNKSAERVFADLVLREKPPVAVFFNQDEHVVRSLMPHDFIMTASDGWTIPKNLTHPHPRSYGTFPKKLRQYVMDEKIMDLTLAIHTMTGLPAKKFNIKNRGRIAKGYFADICVINPETVGDHATYKAPHQYATGIEHLFVNGVQSIKNGVHTGDRGGRAIRRNT